MVIVEVTRCVVRYEEEEMTRDHVDRRTVLRIVSVILVV